VPKLGIGPMRRDQICRGAATVIAREGFTGATMRMVAEEAGVSTGMLNHYFANRQHLLIQSLVFVSERSHEQARASMEGLPPGRARLDAFLDSMHQDLEAAETWRVWLNAYGEAVHLREVRHTMESLLATWYGLISHAIEELVPDDVDGEIPWTNRVDAVLKGLALQAITAEVTLDGEQVRGELIRTLFGGASAQSPPRVQRPRPPLGAGVA
jgi:TetR/AcrR family transcriptional repressor of bet genes